MRSSIRNAFLIGVLALVLLAVASLTIDGRLDGKRTSFAGTARIKPSSDVKNLRAEPTDLIATDPKAKILASSIAVTPLTAHAGQEASVVVTVGDVSAAGEYHGKITWPPGGDDLTLNLTLRVAPRIIVKALQDEVSFQIVRCKWSCWAADWFLPARLRGASRSLWLVSDTAEEETLAVKVVSVRGENGGTTLATALGDSGSPLQIDIPRKLEPLAVSSVALKFDRSQLASDRYRGTMRFGLDGADPVVLSFIADVRDSPVPAFFVVLVGILIGRLAQHLLSAQSQMQQRILSRLYPLQVRASELPDAVARMSILAGLNALKDRLADPKATEADLSASLDKSEQQIIALEQGSKEATAAAMTLDSAFFAKQGIVPKPRPQPPPVAGWKRFVLSLAGTPIDWIEREYWIARPALALLLLLLLTLFGLQTLYVGPGATFGSGGLFDYLPLLLWGLSADVAQRTLQNVGARAASP